jgi:L-ascorbate metabolism protein UlaG (beta-lactamase superfamily)
VRSGFALTGILAVAASALVLSTGCLASFGARPDPARLASAARASRYADGRFVNVLPPTQSNGPGWSTFKELLFGGQQRTPPGPLPLVDPLEIWETPIAEGIRVTWLGHSTLLIEVDGVRVLTDPVWSDRASPSQLIGPQRFHPPPVPLTALPRLDAVIISHDHYDHLDMDSIEALAATGVRFFVPLGVADHLKKWGVPEGQLEELDWWGEARVTSAVSLVATPSRHFSGRGLGDRDTTLWASWVIRSEDRRVYFSGDTGLTPQFEEIGRRLGPFDLVMLEVGAFHPSWGDIHLGPENALEAHRMLGGGPLLPIHWSTFSLAIHAWDEPLERLTELAREQQVTVLTPKLGAPLVVGHEARFDPWWRTVR